jgi:hypothetical protein
MPSPCHSDNGYRTYITTGRRMNSGDELKPRSHFQLSGFPTCLIYSGLPTGTTVIVLPILVKLPRTQILRLVETYFSRQTHHTPARLHPIRSFAQEFGNNISQECELKLRVFVYFLRH